MFAAHSYNKRFIKFFLQLQYPIAPVEVQAYAYVALRAASTMLEPFNASLSAIAHDRALQLQEKFNETFVLGARGEHVALACGLSGDGRLLVSPRSSMGHVLWATFKEADATPSRVLSPAYVEGVGRRLLAPDLFVPQAGVRTLSTQSKRYDPISYHNGSIWPHDTAILAEGLRRAGMHEEAKVVREALLTAYEHFMTPIELFGFVGDGYVEYTTPQGGKACRVQAWSAASLLSLLIDEP
jgi:glycogen debranching enzyme